MSFSGQSTGARSHVAALSRRFQVVARRLGILLLFLDRAHSQAHAQTHALASEPPSWRRPPSLVAVKLGPPRRAALRHRRAEVLTKIVPFLALSNPRAPSTPPCRLLSHHPFGGFCRAPAAPA
jgi:hypothetical protein